MTFHDKRTNPNPEDDAPLTPDDFARIVADAMAEHRASLDALCPDCGHRAERHKIHTCFDCEYGKGCAA